MAATTAGFSIGLLSWIVWRGSAGFVGALRLAAPEFAFAAIFAIVGVMLRAVRLRRQLDLEKLHRVMDSETSDLA